MQCRTKVAQRRLDADSRKLGRGWHNGHKHGQGADIGVIGLIRFHNDLGAINKTQLSKATAKSEDGIQERGVRRGSSGKKINVSSLPPSTPLDYREVVEKVGKGGPTPSRVAETPATGPQER
jgi:hypothetical protein